MGKASSQIRLAVTAAVIMAQLRRLNLDSSWLLTLPALYEYPTSTVNLLLDPWLDPSEQIDYARSFSVQRRVTPALASSIADLEQLLQREASESTSVNALSPADPRPASSCIDAIVLSHAFTDHMHPQTLTDKSVPVRIPLLTTADALTPLRALVGKQRTIFTIAAADMKCRPALLSDNGTQTHSIQTLAPLPANVSILHAVPQERMRMLQGPAGFAWQKLHGGLIILWKDTGSTDRAAYDSLLYSPHGIASTSIPSWLTDDRSAAQHRGIMTSFDRMILPRWLSGTVNLGLPGALQLVSGKSTGKAGKGPAAHMAAAYPAAYVIDTHSEYKEKYGLVAQLLRCYWLGSVEEVKQGADKEKDERQQAAQMQIEAAMQGQEQHSTALVLDVGQTVALQ